MVDILHRVGIKSSPAEVYTALTTVEGLAGWWTTDTQGKGNDVGGVIEFRFEARGGCDAKVLELEPNERVVWEVVEGPEEWLGTKVNWDLHQSGDYTVVLFKHEGWREPGEFMHHCSTKWGIFVMSLKSLVETGKGTPWPDDPRAGDWS